MKKVIENAQQDIHKLNIELLKIDSKCNKEINLAKAEIEGKYEGEMIAKGKQRDNISSECAKKIFEEILRVKPIKLDEIEEYRKYDKWEFSGNLSEMVKVREDVEDNEYYDSLENDYFKWCPVKSQVEDIVNTILNHGLVEKTDETDGAVGELEYFSYEEFNPYCRLSCSDDGYFLTFTLIYNDDGNDYLSVTYQGDYETDDGCQEESGEITMTMYFII